VPLIHAFFNDSVISFVGIIFPTLFIVPRTSGNIVPDKKRNGKNTKTPNAKPDDAVFVKLPICNPIKIVINPNIIYGTINVAFVGLGESLFHKILDRANRDNDSKTIRKINAATNAEINTEDLIFNIFVFFRNDDSFNTEKVIGIAKRPIINTGKLIIPGIIKVSTCFNDPVPVG
jgi:hypothetical protein